MSISCSHRCLQPSVARTSSSRRTPPPRRMPHASCPLRLIPATAQHLRNHRLASGHLSHVTRSADEERVHSGDPGGPQLLYSASSIYNDTIQVIQIPDVPELSPALEGLRGARILILDQSGNIHSVWKEDKYITASYWDFLATLPQFGQKGTIGILGLGAGTVARMMQHFYPDVAMAGWEIDPVVVMASRMCFGMDLMEDDNALQVNTGDALLETSCVEGGFSGLVVDLFCRGKLLPQLTEVDTWKGIKQRLKPGVGARVIVNLGVSPFSTVSAEQADDTIKALDSMLQVFEGEVNVIHINNMDTPGADNTIALTGPLDGLQDAWVKDLPDGLRHLPIGHTWQRWNSDDAPQENLKLGDMGIF